MRKSELSTLVTQRFRICFDLDVKMTKLPNDVLGETPELAAFQQALQRSPDLLRKFLAIQALNEIDRYMDSMFEDSDEPGWLPFDQYDVLQAAAHEMRREELIPFLYEELVHTAAFDYVEPIFGLTLETRVVEPPVVHLIGGNEIVPWRERPDTILRYKDAGDRFLLVHVEQENLLVINLVHRQGLQTPLENIAAIAGDVEKLDAPIYGLLCFVETEDGQLPDRQKEEVTSRCSVHFPGLPVQIQAMKTRQP